MIINPIIATWCFKVEQDALLTFKAYLHDPGNLMSSWQGQDCCNWSGVTCDHATHRVLKLSHRNLVWNAWRDDGYYVPNSDSPDWKSHALTGEINQALLSLRHLIHLDLSNHNLSSINIPKFIGSFQTLVYLNLSFSGFQGVIPNELGNLSRLQYLDLSSSQFTHFIPPQLGNLSKLRYLSLRYSFFSASKIDSFSLSWLYRLSNLRYLDLSSFDLNNRVNWPAINNMHMLQKLILAECGLSEIPIHIPQVNLTHLIQLDLSDNSFNVTLPNWLWNLTTLLYLDLQVSGFHGSIPSTLTNLASLNYLNIGYNNFEHVLEPISKLNNLRSLDFIYFDIGGDIVNLIERLDSMWYELEVVRLIGNNLSGNISSWIAQMKNISIIDLSYNSLSGHITSDIGTLLKLTKLDLSYNSFIGIITKAHFVNLSKLQALDLSNNMLAIKFNGKWVPPFQLRSLHLASCKIGPKFPKWLRGQTQLLLVSLSNASITSVIPTWLWNLYSIIIDIDLSYNNIMGSLPTSFELSKIQGLDLTSNNISGLLPSVWGDYMSYLHFSNNYIHGPFPVKLDIPSAVTLSLSSNRINDSITYSLCDGMPYLQFLDLANNDISGEIPNCWKNISNLEYIDLSNNKITGELPSSIGSHYERNEYQQRQINSGIKINSGNYVIDAVERLKKRDMRN